MNDRIIQLIGMLVDKTESNELVWEKTSIETEFKVNFQNGTVSTDNWTDYNTGNEIIDFKIFNKDGNEIGSWSFISNDVEAKILKNLHATIVRKYLKIDETLDGIMNELDNYEL